MQTEWMKLFLYHSFLFDGHLRKKRKKGGACPRPEGLEVTVLTLILWNDRRPQLSSAGGPQPNQLAEPLAVMVSYDLYAETPLSLPLLSLTVLLAAPPAQCAPVMLTPASLLFFVLSSPFLAFRSPSCPPPPSFLLAEAAVFMYPGTARRHHPRCPTPYFFLCDAFHRSLPFHGQPACYEGGGAVEGPSYRTGRGRGGGGGKNRYPAVRIGGGLGWARGRVREGIGAVAPVAKGCSKCMQSRGLGRHV